MSEHLKDFPDIAWTIGGFFIFLIVFAFFVLSTYIPQQKKIHSHLQLLPLEDDKTGETL